MRTLEVHFWIGKLTSTLLFLKGNWRQQQSAWWVIYHMRKLARTGAIANWMQYLKILVKMGMKMWDIWITLDLFYVDTDYISKNFTGWPTNAQTLMSPLHLMVFQGAAEQRLSVSLRRWCYQKYVLSTCSISICFHHMWASEARWKIIFGA